MLKRLLSVAAFIVFCSGPAWSQETIPFITPPIKLKVESQVNPVGIGVAAPRFSWVFKSPVAGDAQAAYRIVVASARDKLGQPDLWDSGRVESPETMQIPYAGKPLASGARAYWAVTVWNKTGQAVSPVDPAMFTMGVLSPADWKAKWIAFPADDANKVNEPAPCFRKEFALAKPVTRAVVRVCGLGQYELTLNGVKVGDAVLTPAWTSYAKTCNYDSYDVTAQLKAGANTLGVMLGNGMYNVLRLPNRYTKFPLANEPAGSGSLGVPKLILQLEVEYEDGAHEVIATDGSWKTARGPITTSHTYGGEDYDARREMPGWDSTGFNDSAWQNAALSEAPGSGKAELVANITPLSTIAKSYPSVKITQPANRPNVWVYDFGQNLSGWPHLVVKGAAGTVVKLTPGELLDRNGAVTQASSGSPMWFSYTLKGHSSGEDWHPRFSYYGYRYIQVEGAAPVAIETAPAAARVIELSSEFVHADLPVVGTFESSDKNLNAIHSLINMAILSNAQSLLTDCPHREKLGWLEQTHLMADAIAMNYDVSNLYAKMCRDMRDAQTPDGLVPDIAPEYTRFPGGFRDSPEWGSAAVIDPWLLYEYYGDTRTLEAQYGTMKKYVDYLGTKAKANIVSHGLGDWYDIGPAKPGKAQLTSLGLTATAVYFQDLTILTQAAGLLHHEDDVNKYSRLRDTVRAAFNQQFWNPATGEYEKGSQTANAMPLALGLVEPAHQDTVREKLAASLRANKNRVTAGDVGFSYVVKALTHFNQGDVMYDLMTQTDGPGYMDQLKKGATSLTEAWDALPTSSQNHLMLGHAEAWLYCGLAGIKDGPASGGKQSLEIAPQVAGIVPDAEAAWVRATYESPRGTIVSSWRHVANHLTMTVTIPPSMSARVVVPGRNIRRPEFSLSPQQEPLVVPTTLIGVFNVQSGTFTFESDLP